MKVLRSTTLKHYFVSSQKTKLFWRLPSRNINLESTVERSISTSLNSIDEENRELATMYLAIDYRLETKLSTTMLKFMIW